MTTNPQEPPPQTNMILTSAKPEIATQKLIKLINKRSSEFEESYEKFPNESPVPILWLQKALDEKTGLKVFEKFYDNGSLKAKGTQNDAGEYHGKVKIYEKCVSGYLHHQLQNHYLGNKLSYIIEYKNGEPHGKCTYFRTHNPIKFIGASAEEQASCIPLTIGSTSSNIYEQEFIEGHKTGSFKILFKKFGANQIEYIELAKFGQTLNGHIIGMFRAYQNGVQTKQMYYNRDKSKLTEDKDKIKMANGEINFNFYESMYEPENRSSITMTKMNNGMINNFMDYHKRNLQAKADFYECGKLKIIYRNDTFVTWIYNPRSQLYYLDFIGNQYITSYNGSSLYSNGKNYDQYGNVKYEGICKPSSNCVFGPFKGNYRKNYSLEEGGGQKFLVNLDDGRAKGYVKCYRANGKLAKIIKGSFRGDQIDLVSGNQSQMQWAQFYYPNGAIENYESPNYRLDFSQRGFVTLKGPIDQKSYMLSRSKMLHSIRPEGDPIDVYTYSDTNGKLESIGYYGNNVRDGVFLEFGENSEGTICVKVSQYSKGKIQNILTVDNEKKPKKPVNQVNIIDQERERRKEELKKRNELKNKYNPRTNLKKVKVDPLEQERQTKLENSEKEKAELLITIKELNDAQDLGKISKKKIGIFLSKKGDSVLNWYNGLFKNDDQIITSDQEKLNDAKQKLDIVDGFLYKLKDPGYFKNKHADPLKEDKEKIVEEEMQETKVKSAEKQIIKADKLLKIDTPRFDFIKEEVSQINQKSKSVKPTSSAKTEIKNNQKSGKEPSNNIDNLEMIIANSTPEANLVKKADSNIVRRLSSLNADEFKNQVNNVTPTAQKKLSSLNPEDLKILANNCSSAVLARLSSLKFEDLNFLVSQADSEKIKRISDRVSSFTQNDWEKLINTPADLILLTDRDEIQNKPKNATNIQTTGNKKNTKNEQNKSVDIVLSSSNSNKVDNNNKSQKVMASRKSNVSNKGKSDFNKKPRENTAKSSRPIANRLKAEDSTSTELKGWNSSFVKKSPQKEMQKYTNLKNSPKSHRAKYQNPVPASSLKTLNKSVSKDTSQPNEKELWTKQQKIVNEESIVIVDAGTNKQMPNVEEISISPLLNVEEISISPLYNNPTICFYKKDEENSGQDIQPTIFVSQIPSIFVSQISTISEKQDLIGEDNRESSHLSPGLFVKPNSNEEQQPPQADNTIESDNENKDKNYKSELSDSKAVNKIYEETTQKPIRIPYKPEEEFTQKLEEKLLSQLTAKKLQATDENPSTLAKEVSKPKGQKKSTGKKITKTTKVIDVKKAQSERKPLSNLVQKPEEITTYEKKYWKRGSHKSNSSLVGNTTTSSVINLNKKCLGANLNKSSNSSVPKIVEQSSLVTVNKDTDPNSTPANKQVSTPILSTVSKLQPPKNTKSLAKTPTSKQNSKYSRIQTWVIEEKGDRISRSPSKTPTASEQKQTEILKRKEEIDLKKKEKLASQLKTKLDKKAQTKIIKPSDYYVSDGKNNQSQTNPQRASTTAKKPQAKKNLTTAPITKPSNLQPATPNITINKESVPTKKPEQKKPATVQFPAQVIVKEHIKKIDVQIESAEKKFWALVGSPDRVKSSRKDSSAENSAAMKIKVDMRLNTSNSDEPLFQKTEEFKTRDREDSLEKSSTKIKGSKKQQLIAEIINFVKSGEKNLEIDSDFNELQCDKKMTDEIENEIIRDGLDSQKNDDEIIVDVGADLHEQFPTFPVNLAEADLKMQEPEQKSPAKGNVEIWVVEDTIESLDKLEDQPKPETEVELKPYEPEQDPNIEVPDKDLPVFLDKTPEKTLTMPEIPSTPKSLLGVSIPDFTIQKITNDSVSTVIKLLDSNNGKMIEILCDFSSQVPSSLSPVKNSKQHSFNSKFLNKRLYCLLGNLKSELISLTSEINDHLLETYEDLFNKIDSIQKSWLTHILSIDQLVEKHLEQNCKILLNELLNCLNGKSKIIKNQFKVYVVFEKKEDSKEEYKLDFQPSIDDMIIEFKQFQDEAISVLTFKDFKKNELLFLEKREKMLDDLLRQDEADDIDIDKSEYFSLYNTFLLRGREVQTEFQIFTSESDKQFPELLVNTQKQECSKSLCQEQMPWDKIINSSIEEIINLTEIEPFNLNKLKLGNNGEISQSDTYNLSVESLKGILEGYDRLDAQIQNQELLNNDQCVDLDCTLVKKTMSCLVADIKKTLQAKMKELSFDNQKSILKKLETNETALEGIPEDLNGLISTMDAWNRLVDDKDKIEAELNCLIEKFDLMDQYDLYFEDFEIKIRKGLIQKYQEYVILLGENKMRNEELYEKFNKEQKMCMSPTKYKNESDKMNFILKGIKEQVMSEASQKNKSKSKRSEEMVKSGSLDKKVEIAEEVKVEPFKIGENLKLEMHNPEEPKKEQEEQSKSQITTEQAMETLHSSISPTKTESKSHKKNKKNKNKNKKQKKKERLAAQETSQNQLENTPQETNQPSEPIKELESPVKKGSSNENQQKNQDNISPIQKPKDITESQKYGEISISKQPNQQMINSTFTIQEEIADIVKDLNNDTNLKISQNHKDETKYNMNLLNDTEDIERSPCQEIATSEQEPVKDSDYNSGATYGNYLIPGMDSDDNSPNRESVVLITPDKTEPSEHEKKGVTPPQKRKSDIPMWAAIMGIIPDKMHSEITPERDDNEKLGDKKWTKSVDRVDDKKIGDSGFLRKDNEVYDQKLKVMDLNSPSPNKGGSSDNETFDRKVDDNLFRSSIDSVDRQKNKNNNGMDTPSFP